MTQKITTQPLGCLSLFHSDQSFFRTINSRQSDFRCLALGSLSCCQGTAQQPNFQLRSSASASPSYATLGKPPYLSAPQFLHLKIRWLNNVTWGLFLSLDIGMETGERENCHINTVSRHSKVEGWVKSPCLRTRYSQVVVVHAFNLRIQEAEAGSSLSSTPVWSTE